MNCGHLPTLVGLAVAVHVAVVRHRGVVAVVDDDPQLFAVGPERQPFRVADAGRQQLPIGVAAAGRIGVDGRPLRIADGVLDAGVAGGGDRHVELLVPDRDVLQQVGVVAAQLRGAGVGQPVDRDLAVVGLQVAVGVRVAHDPVGLGDEQEHLAADLGEDHVVRLAEPACELGHLPAAHQPDLAGGRLRHEQVAARRQRHEPRLVDARVHGGGPAAGRLRYRAWLNGAEPRAFGTCTRTRDSGPIGFCALPDPGRPDSADAARPDR
jgi:hypothetical protein